MNVIRLLPPSRAYFHEGVPFTYCSPATQAFCLFLEHIMLIPTRAFKYALCFDWKTLPQIFLWIIPSFNSGLNSNFTSSVRPSLTTNSKVVSLVPPVIALFYFLHHTYHYLKLSGKCLFACYCHLSLLSIAKK